MIRVVKVNHLENYKLLVNFSNGERRIYDASPLLKYDIFSKLKDVSFFSRAKVDCGSVVWNDELDIAPEELYQKGIPYFS